VLIVRATNARRARTTIDRAIAPLARDRGWQSATTVRRGARITTWGKPGGPTEIAYAGRHSCLVIGTSAAVVEQCVLAAGDHSERLSPTQGFGDTLSEDPQSPVTCYISLAALLRDLAGQLPPLGGAPSALSPVMPGPVAAGAVVLAIAPEPGGLRLHADYRGSAAPAAEPVSADLGRFGRILPRDAAAYALINDPEQLLSPFRAWIPQAGLARRPTDEPAELDDYPSPGSPAQIKLPGPALIALLPADGDSSPLSVIAAVPESQAGGLPTWLGQLAMGRPLARAAIGDFFVVASSEDALLRCRRAAEDAEARLPPPDADAEIEIWAKPGELSPGLAGIEEMRVKVRANATGGEADITVKAKPSNLIPSP
jgi:hypothetical protein